MIDIFQFDFMVRAFVAGTVIAIIAPLIGMFLVVRRYSLMADTLAHVSLVGVAVGLFLNTQPVVTATIASVIAAVGIERLRRTKHLFGESVLALFLSGSLAVASVLMSVANGFNANLLSFLFGSVTTIQPTDVVMILGLGAVVLLAVAVLYKEFFAVAFDEELAQAGGIPARVFSTLLVILAAVTVSVAMRIVGVLLVGALMVIPVITAMQFDRSFRETLLLSVVFSLLSVFLGLFLSYYLGLVSGGTIVIIALGIFLVSLLAKTKV